MNEGHCHTLCRAIGGDYGCGSRSCPWNNTICEDCQGYYGLCGCNRPIGDPLATTPEVTTTEEPITIEEPITTTTEPTTTTTEPTTTISETTTTAPLNTTVPPTLATRAPVYGEPYAKGDISGSGTVTIGDALEVLRFLAGMQNAISTGGRGSQAWRAATVTGGLEPAISDALEILKYLAGMANILNGTGTTPPTTAPPTTTAPQATDSITTPNISDETMITLSVPARAWEQAVFGPREKERDTTMTIRIDDTTKTIYYYTDISLTKFSAIRINSSGVTLGAVTPNTHIAPDNGIQQYRTRLWVGPLDSINFFIPSGYLLATQSFEGNGRDIVIGSVEYIIDLTLFV
jgi:hypothetical protein